MSQSPDISIQDPPSAEPVRIRTLVLLRWVAVLGQLAAVVVAWAMGVRFPVWPVLALIVAAAALNLCLMAGRPARMSPARVMDQLIFDVVQLALLLALTGGLTNPFALLILAPVTVAASALSAQRTVVLGLLAVALISMQALVALSLHGPDGTVLALPRLYQLGHWLALVIGVAFFAAYDHRVSAELSATEKALFATQMALAREQRLQHLGGVVAAAAHEMGTPLATIKLIAAELQDDLDDRPELSADLAELRSSVDRCAQILRDMGRSGKDDLLLHNAPLQTVLEEAAEPHQNRGTQLLIDGGSLSVRRDPAIVHALRNLIQNAVDFADSEVHVDTDHHAGRLHVTIRDDGPGFAPATLARLGDPYPSAPSRSGTHRKGYEGMGLGLFIAKTLLERSGAKLGFGNGGPGAVVRVTWDESDILADSRRPLGVNPKYNL